MPSVEGAAPGGADDVPRHRRAALDELDDAVHQAEGAAAAAGEHEGAEPPLDGFTLVFEALVHSSLPFVTCT